MAEAMKECSQAKISDKKNGKKNQKPNVQESDLYCTDDEFCILEDDPGVGLMPKNGEPQIRMLTDEPIKIVDNHFAIPPGKLDVLKAPKHFPKPLVLFALREMSLVWHLYGGSDFKSSPGKKKRKAKKVSHSVDNGVTFSDEKSIDVDTYKTSVSFCKVTPLTKTFDANAVHFSMEHVTIDENKNSSLETWLCKGGLERNHNVLMELHLNKVQFQREIYPLDNEYASRYILLIHDIEIRDRLASSQINKFLYQYSNKTMPRQSHSNMIDIKAVYTRPDPKRSSASYSNSDVECSLKVSCNPLRLNVDQDALMFLIEFFQEVLEIFPEDSSEGESESGAVNVSVKTSNTCTNQVSNLSAGNQNIKTSETFYRFFSFSPEVLIRIDYQGKRVVMEQGALRGLLMGLGQLNSSEIKLKSICYRHGLLGLHKILSFATNEWQQDIIKNQLPSLLGGVGPMHSFVQLFQGIKDLFYLPVMQYRRDGQIVRGLQYGASSFSTSTAMAFLDLTSRLVGAIQTFRPSQNIIICNFLSSRILLSENCSCHPEF
ncbi:autophagy-related protein 2 homolog A-like isoform X2 [Stegodyphus dumicola]|uniref:autophagy-related protein 2 homolog A-like isoform X2 n=1 Tax=Stegodyphus dumicola TaxID=202533 RepID=UPI0015AAF6FE|nr:autophagy-related protein 2 homolog A-like isoform X2 [Stegodyphus dumicola]